jgi:hypothetical protein
MRSPARESRESAAAIARGSGARAGRMPGTAIAALQPVDARRSDPPLAASAPRARPSANPVRSMLALSAAVRAVASEPGLESAVAALQREACRLTEACEATVIALDRARGEFWTLDDSMISDEVAALVERVADSGKREVFGHALIEPIGGPAGWAVLVLRRRAHHRFDANDIALVAALIGAVSATLDRLLQASLGRGSEPELRRR